MQPTDDAMQRDLQDFLGQVNHGRRARVPAARHQHQAHPADVDRQRLLHRRPSSRGRTGRNQTRGDRPDTTLGILGMAGEFRHQTVTQTFLVTPDRGRVVAAKLIAYPLAGITLTLTILAFTAAVATGWLAAKGITPSLLDARLGRVLLGAVLAAGLCGLVGVGVAALVRNQVAALVGVAVWVLLVEGLLMSLLHAPSLGKWLPSAAAAALTNPGGAQLSRLTGALVLAGYALALALVGTRLVVRRDIT